MNDYKHQNLEMALCDQMLDSCMVMGMMVMEMNIAVIPRL